MQQIDQLIVELENLSARYYVPSIPRESAEILWLVSFMYSIRKEYVIVIEVGTGVGYSTAWILKGILEAKAQPRIITIEQHDRRVKIAKEAFLKYGFSQYVEILEGNAIEILESLDVSSVDIVFLDATKSEYGRYLESLYPRIVPSGVVMAHNVVGFKEAMSDFIEEISNDEKWITVISTLDPEGLSVSIKK